ncbi:MAG TPA: glycoside hydrolase family 3 N-terminal domain-containing protein [Terriglobales bacterium]|jgi:beta-glucosidase|nr:glycoside hydrolase family 3 N-terminal domain-containing protein [Terriglobales bacterium]
MKRPGTWCLAIFVCLLLLSTLGAQQPTPAYKNPALSVDARVIDLLSRMTLEEKVAQLESTWQNHSQGQLPEEFFVDDKGQLDEAKARQMLKNGLGQVSRPSENRGPGEMAEFTNRVQHIAVENTRLGIPLMFHEECLHGLAASDATSYPQAIGLAATWNDALVRRVFDAVAKEARSRGAHECLMPVVDLARDPRWGRTEETYGEDPYLAGRMGIAAIKGLQGDGPAPDTNHLYATLKHFAVHSQPEAGANIAPANYSERTVREYFLPPFEAGIQKANVRAVMPSYNELDGVPNHSNIWLLRNILRSEFGFKGTVVSDYFAIEQLITVHHVATNCEQAAKLAITAGVDIELPFLRCYKTLPALVRSGQIPESLINESVARVLRAKFDLGLFEKPYADPQAAVQNASPAQSRELALQAAHETITLLKNDNNLLPLDLTKIKRIAVIGPNAGEPHLGGYSGTPRHGVSVLEGIKNKAAGKAEVFYAEGCRITESKPVWEEDKVLPADPELDKARLSAAVEAMSKADVGIVVVGENEQTSREGWSSTHLGDRDNLDLLGRQDELVSRLFATGKPVVVVLLHGRPNSINFIKEHAPAILDGWYLGQEGGAALADVLFGDYNPAGRLPITVPRSVGQLPDYYYQKPSARRPYLFTDNSPLFPFGYGLSYTKFNYSNLRVEPSSIAMNGTAKVSVDVTNGGSRTGDEVVQLYIRDEISSVTRPVKELKGFERVPIQPGETRTVTFEVGPEELRFYNREMKRVVEPGTFKIMVGPNSVDLTSISLEVK